ncbi:MAG TPA: hypothetical protein VK634_00590, partial [Reyranella sp.]|nr:hypothetical protein [Reyranella sp.]
MHCTCRGLVVREDHERFDLELALQFSTAEDTDPPRMKLGLSSSSGPRPSGSLMIMSEPEGRGPEELEH